jgi:hypothetical protein
MSKRKFKDGDEVVASSRIAGYLGISVGTPGVVLGYCYNGEYNVNFNGKCINGKADWFDISSKKTSIEQFHEQIEKAQEKIKSTQEFILETQSKIDFMKETGSDLFIENEFKAYHTLTIIEKGDMTKMEKAKAIAALIS